MSDMFEWAKKEVALACEREKSDIKSDNDGMPTINPQEPKLDTLDKVRAEIRDWQRDIHDNEYDAKTHDFVFEGIYEIIDELKTESEDKE